jgi:hypothetical protein
MKFIICIFLIAIQGCSSTTNPQSRAEKKQWNYAYDGVDFILSKNKKEDTERMILLVKDYPEIVNYGFSTFSIDSLNYWVNKTGDLYYKKIEVERFCIVATTQQCNQAVDNVLSVEKTIKKELRLSKGLYSKLNEKEQKYLSDNYKIIFYEASEVGIVTDRQVRNLSTPGSNFGAEAGGAAGAVAYVNNVNPANYSLNKDVSSTLLGAVIGAALFNKQAVEQYEIRYTLKLRNGDIKQFDVLSSTPLAEGMGACIGMPYGTKVDQSLCTMTLAEFRDKYAGELKN